MWWPIGTGRLGVDAFFVLSGFLVVRSWRSARERAGSRRAALRSFGRRRILRTIPAYWLSLLVLIPLTEPALLREPKNLLLLGTVNQYVSTALPGRVDTVYWSLTTEWHFYLLVPLVALVLARVNRWVVFGACATATVLWWTHAPLGLPASFVFGRLDQFVIGAIASDVVAHAQASRARPTVLVRTLRTRGVGLAALLAVVALGTYHGSSFGKSRGNWFDPFFHPLVGVCVAVGLVALCTSGRRTLLESRALRFAGLVSYSLYLWHYPILQHGLAWTGVDAPLGVLDGVVIAALLALSVAVAVASYLLVERPLLARRTPAPSEPRPVELVAA
jgi:peptidoglycan/LPS O-acetylase OafA/YrhL